MEYKYRWNKIICRMLAVMIIVILGVALATPFGVTAEEVSSNSTENKRVVRVGYYIAPGFQDYDENTGEYSGSSYEYLMAISQYTNWEYEFVPVNFSDGVDMLENGELDLMNNVSKTPEREQILDFSDYASGANYGCLIVDANDNSYAYNDYQAFENMQIGVLGRSIFKSYFLDFCEEHGFTPNMYEYESDDDMTAALSAGEIDARIVSSSYQDGSRVVAKFGSMDYYFAVPKGETEIAQELNDAMLNIQTDMPNFVQQLNEKYNNKYVENAAVLTKEEHNYVEDHGTIKVAVTDSWYPIFYMNEKGQSAGPLSDIYDRIADATGLKFKYITYDDDQSALDAIVAGDVDMIVQFPYDFIYANKWGVQLTSQINDIEYYRVMKESKSNSAIETIAIYGDPYLQSQLVKMYGDQVTYETYETVEGAVDAVLNGKADCTFLNYYTSTRFQNRGKYISIQYILVPSLQYNFGLGISCNEDPLLKSIIGKGLQTIDSDHMDSIFELAAQDDEVPDFEIQFYQNPGIFILVSLIIAVIVVLAIASSFYSIRMNKKNVELERAQKAQTDFLARMSHDMRTPMNGILGLSYLMEKENEIGHVKGYIPELQEASNYLLQLINDVLDVNKIESGNLTLHPKVCDEELLFQSIVDLLKPLMDEKQIHFRFIKTNIVWQYMLLDEQRVKQIFINVLNNAIKFTPNGGRIDLEMELVSQTKDMIRDKFVIRDNGIGISEEFLPHVFEPFQQEERCDVDSKSGSGLGLSIVKQLVELMDGTITVTSTKNVGTEFTIYINFPLAEKPVEDTQIETKLSSTNCNYEENKIPTSEKDIPDSDNSNYVSQTEKSKLRPGLSILMCEDHPLNAKIAMKLLEQQDAKVTWAKDGQEGVGIFQVSKPGTYDVILMDIRMPIVNGLDATRMIRATNHSDAKNIPIIAMSANAYEEDVKKSLDAGMNAHLSKPIEPEKLYETIMKYI